MLRGKRRNETCQGFLFFFFGVVSTTSKSNSETKGQLFNSLVHYEE